MEINKAVNLFLDSLLDEQVSEKIYRQYQNELTGFVEFFQNNGSVDVETSLDLSIIEQYFNQRTSHLSPRYRSTIAHKYQHFLDFLSQKGMIHPKLAMLFPFFARVGTGAKTRLLDEIRELEQALYDLKRVTQIRDRFARLKREVITVARRRIPEEKLLFEFTEDEIKKLKEKAHTELQQQFDQLIQVGSFLVTEESTKLAGAISEITTAVAKLGREYFKANSLFESKQERETKFLQELSRRLGKTEQLLAELPALKQEVQAEARLKIIKNLLPVIDGLEAALATIPDSFTSVETDEKKNIRKSIFNQIFGARNETDQSVVNFGQWKDGLNMILQRMLTILSQEGIHPVQSIGAMFDPHYHIAVAVEPAKDEAENIITGEQLKGYCRGEEVIRYAEVAVARGKEINGEQ